MKISKNLISCINNVPLLKKFLIALTLVTVLFCGTSTFISMAYITAVDKEILYNQISSKLAIAGKRIDYNLHSIESICNLMLEDEIIQSNLQNIKKTTFKREIGPIYNLLYKRVISYFFEMHPYFVSSTALFADPYTVSSNIMLDSELPKSVKINLQEEARKVEGAPVWLPQYDKQNSIYMARAIRQISNLDLSIIGYLVIKLDMNQLIHQEIFTDYKDCNPFFIFVDNNNSISFFHSPELSLEQTNGCLNKLKSKQYTVLKINGEAYFAAKSEIKDYNWTFISLMPYEQTSKAIFYSRLIQTTIVLSGILIMLFFSYFLMKSVTRHIHSLLAKINAYRGDRSYVPSDSYDYARRFDEVGILHQQFERMMHEITELIDRNYKTNLLIKDAQLAALENQINPHFLYNTLESINWRAKAIGASYISQMVESLGNLLRLTLKNNAETYTIKKELELIENYITIQKLRFEDRLKIVTECEESCYSCHIPKLSLQPLVENAIHYSLENSIDDCLINISVQQENDRLCIKVCNSGSEFEDNLLEKLKNGTIKVKHTGIGILNIDKRIKLLYGEEFGLSFSNVDMMAVATLIIPNIQDKGDFSNAPVNS